MIRWGNILFLLLAILILFLSWLIKYPNVVDASVEIEKSRNSEIYIGKLTSKNYNFEKAQKEQEAHISLLAYPEYENDIILKTVDTILRTRFQKTMQLKLIYQKIETPLFPKY